jgi:RNA polymerase sigma-70 factor (ECF subfamily)
LRGDEKAFEELLNKYRRPVFSICLRMVRNETDAEDLAQEVFVRTFNVLDRYNPSYQFSSWIYRITSNLCIDFIRKKRKGIVSIDEPISGREGEMVRQIPSDRSDPGRDMETKEMIAVLDEAVSALPQHYRIIVILRHQEQLSYEEISETLGIPLGTVKARIHRARNMIKDYFAGKGMLEGSGGKGVERE